MYDFGVQWAIPEKKKNSGRADMEFPGVSKKEHVKFPGVNWKFQGWPRKNSVEIPGDLVFGLGIFKGSNTIL